MISIRKKALSLKEFYSPGKPAVACTENQCKLISKFNDKIRKDLVKFESVPCLCGSNTFDMIAEVDRYGILQDTVICVECGLVQSNPRMTKEELTAFYSSDLYRLCYDGENYLEKYENKYTPEYGRHIFYEIDKVKRIDPGISILEIGAGGGWNLLPFIDKGAKVLGIDYSPSLIELGLKHAIPMKQGSIDTIPGQYDVIVINHVLEHFLNPVDSLRKIALHSKHEGIIYISVPNILNFNMGQLQNAHTYYFSPYTLERYCAEAGLGLLAIGKAQNIHLFGIFRLGDAQDRPAFRCKKTKINFNLVKLKTLVKRILRPQKKCANLKR